MAIRFFASLSFREITRRYSSPSFTRVDIQLLLEKLCGQRDNRRSLFHFFFSLFFKRKDYTRGARRR